jgi:hypothetical protein
VEDWLFDEWRRRLGAAAERYATAKEAARKAIKDREDATFTAGHEAAARALNSECVALKEYTLLQIAFSKALLEGGGPPPDEQ